LQNIIIRNFLNRRGLHSSGFDSRPNYIPPLQKKVGNTVQELISQKIVTVFKNRSCDFQSVAIYLKTFTVIFSAKNLYFVKVRIAIE